jgi:hypothetical protein
MVTASRKHLTVRYASGVDLLLWETEKRLIPDLDAIRSVTEALSAGQAEGLDMGAALVLVQAARLGLDRLEYELFEGAQAMGMQSEAIAAVLDLADAAAADKRHRWLTTRRAIPYTPAEFQPPETLTTPAEAKRAQAGRRSAQASGSPARAAQAADRAAETAMRAAETAQQATQQAAQQAAETQRQATRHERAEHVTQSAAAGDDPGEQLP